MAQPQVAACALINYRGLDEVTTGILASSDVPIVQRRDFVRLHTEAKLRIANTFGATRASAVIVIGSTEALAMQVDFRERYLWSLRFGAVDSGTVQQWTSRSQFFSGDDEELTRHYAMAKEEVRLWVQKLGREERVRLPRASSPRRQVCRDI